MALLLAIVAAAVAAGVLIAAGSGWIGSNRPSVPAGVQGAQNHVINVTDSVSVGDKR